MPSTFLIVITSLLIISLTVPTVKSDSHHVTVRPTDSNSSICGDHAACDTLSNLISDNSSYFSDGLDLTLNFLKGTHRLNLSGEQLKIEQKRNVIWSGESAVIVCQKPLAMIFIDIEYLEFKNLSVSKCGDKMHSDRISESTILHNKSISAALFVSSVYTFHMEGVLIELSNGYGLFTFNLYGNTNIHKCFFVDNNKNCRSPQFSREACVGGNIAMYFFPRYRENAVKRLVNISITSSTIGGGSDESLTTVSCTNRLEMADSPSVSKANGLAVIFAQFNYQVNVSVLETKFYNNTRNRRHPSVLVHDYSRVINYVQIHSSSFEKELNAVLISMSKPNESSNLSMTADSETVLIKNCSFTNGYHFSKPNVFICIKPLASNLSPLHFQTIMITGCTFYSYNYQFFKQIIVQVFYFFPHINSFPSILIEINNCSFLRNSPRFLILIYTRNKKMSLNSYNRNYNSSSIFTIKYSRIECRNKYCLFLIEGAKNRRISDVELSNCTFISARIVARNAHVVLRDCTFSKSHATPVSASNSIIVAEGQNIFEQNEGIYGGALHLAKSILLLMPKSRTIISENQARYGGGIFAEPISQPFRRNSELLSFCTITQLQSSAQLEFKNNQASYAGNSIYGGRYTKCAYNCTGEYWCQTLPDTDTFDYEPLPQYISITPHSNKTKYTEVSSPANRICLCKNNEPTDNCEELEITVFPGQKFNVSVIALGELNGSTPVIMTSRSGDFELNIDNGLYFLTVNCSTLSYSVHRISSNISHQTITLRISEETTKVTRLDQSQLQNFKIRIHFSSCPRGLVFSDKNHKCVCHSFLENFGISCDSKNGEVQIKDKQWIGYYNSQLAIRTSYPMDYLISGDKHINLSEPNEQCNFSRTGILCGACETDLSEVLGTSNCMECSNVYLLLIIPFALAGVALVVLLLKCNLTVSVGHINGIIFYANIVQFNKTLLFSNKNTADQIFSTFIAWLNLDLNIETCFFEGMDAYAKVGLQFVFPVYLWVIIGLIISAARYSSRLANLIGSNSVPVLATLFLLSYVKLLRTIIAAVAFTFIEFEDNQQITVWLQNGNVQYFHSTHIVLVLTALFFLLIYILPLTLLVLLAPCLQSWSHHKPFKWVNRLKPFLDAYQGPYKDTFRYWAGVLLMVRLGLLIVYTSNFWNDPSNNFFSTTAATSLLAVVLIWRRVYKHKLASCIELISLANIVVVCSVNWLTTTTGYTQWRFTGKYLTYISVSFMMLVCAGIVLYQLKQQFLSATFTRCLKRIHPAGDSIANRELKVSQPATSSVVELEECNQLKEPLLDSD